MRAKHGFFFGQSGECCCSIPGVTELQLSSSSPFVQSASPSQTQLLNVRHSPSLHLYVVQSAAVNRIKTIRVWINKNNMPTQFVNLHFSLDFSLSTYDCNFRWEYYIELWSEVICKRLQKRHFGFRILLERLSCFGLINIDHILNTVLITKNLLK